jgi:hypothetical protein
VVLASGHGDENQKSLDKGRADPTGIFDDDNSAQHLRHIPHTFSIRRTDSSRMEWGLDVSHYVSQVTGMNRIPDETAGETNEN